MHVHHLFNLQSAALNIFLSQVYNKQSNVYLMPSILHTRSFNQENLVLKSGH